MIWLEFAVVLGSIFVGARLGGVGLGLAAAIGLAILVFVFGLPPSSPPGSVLAIIVAVVAAAATMEAAGGMTYLIGVAQKLLRANPKQIVFVGPLVAYLFTFCAGTGHVAYSILPVIAEVSRKAGVRPERAMSISVIASQQAITASPLSAATAGLLALLDPMGVTLGKILLVCVPATLIGCVLGALSVVRKGPELADDPEYQQRLKQGIVEAPVEAKPLEGVVKRRAAGSVAIFLAAAAVIVGFGVFEGLRPTYTETRIVAGSVPLSTIESAVSELMDPEKAREVIPRARLAEALENARTAPPETREVAVSMGTIIQIVMYTSAGLMMLFCGAKPPLAAKASVATAGVVAVVSIVGLGWLGNCFFDGNRELIVSTLSETVQARPWTFAIALFALSVLLFSQASTVAALMPVGLALGLPAATLVAFFPAVNGYFFLPTYATIVAAIAFDRTGTTKIGKFVVNHSFMRPGLVATISGCAVGFLISRMVF